MGGVNGQRFRTTNGKDIDVDLLLLEQMGNESVGGFGLGVVFGKCGFCRGKLLESGRDAASFHGLG